MPSAMSEQTSKICVVFNEYCGKPLPPGFSLDRYSKSLLTPQSTENECDIYRTNVKIMHGSHMDRRQVELVKTAMIEAGFVYETDHTVSAIKNKDGSVQTVRHYDRLIFRA